MFYSMTGYSHVSAAIPNIIVSVELRTLNGKALDISLRLPPAIRKHEIELRALLAAEIIRGKAEMTIQFDHDPDYMPVPINKTLLGSYLRELQAIAEENAIATPDLLSIAMRIPGAIDTPEETLDETQWQAIKKLVQDGIKQLCHFRSTEGEKLKADILHRLNIIRQLIEEVIRLEPARKEKLKAKLHEQISGISILNDTDRVRFEQEITYYLERIDITEELVRLQAHGDYFVETALDGSTLEKGKKLSFITQEMAREMNTLGAKAADAAIQRLVVMMKDELEKIKEQLNNIL